MEAAKALIENCWIDKKRDKELYMEVRRELPKCQKFFREQLGWTIINNEQILKVEKIPAHAESYMGITDFSESRDYCLFCAVLAFLEDKEEQEQFLLSKSLRRNCMIAVIGIEQHGVKSTGRWKTRSY